MAPVSTGVRARPLLLLLLGCAVDAEYDAIAFPYCTKEGEYFDISSLLCTQCPRVTATSQGTVRDAAGTSCKCAPGTYFSGSACEACPAGFAPTSDRTACLPCNQTLVGGECQCTEAGRVIVEADSNGALLDEFQCRSCPAGHYPVPATGGVCVACPAAHMQARADSSGCTCRDGYSSVVHGSGFWGRSLSCVPNAERVTLASFYPSSAARKTFAFLPAAQGGTYTVEVSQIVQQLLLPSATACLRAINLDTDPPTPRAQPLVEGNQACQAVGNLCALYDYAAAASACVLYDQLNAAAGVVDTSNQEWRRHLPGLFYESTGVGAVSEAAPQIPSVLALPPRPGSRLRYLLAAYSTNGTYLGLQELTTQLQLCRGGAADPAAFLDVGTDMRVACDVPPVDLLAVAEITFYDLYLYYDEVRSPHTPPAPSHAHLT